MLAGKGKTYEGRSAPYWYGGGQFYELLLALGDQPVRYLIAQFDGCTSGNAGEIVAALGWSVRAAPSLIARRQ
jgi:hypothetical protein